ncbi:MAG: hypothetical protein C4337_00055 [Armatimonadota bacterium]
MKMIDNRCFMAWLCLEDRTENPTSLWRQGVRIGFWSSLLAIGLWLWGCQPASQEVSPTRSVQEQRWLQAILEDTKQPCTMQILLSNEQNPDALPKVLHYERPHPDFVRMTERLAQSCQIGTDYPTIILTPKELIHWYPHQSLCRMVPRFPDKAGLQHIAQLFTHQARLRAVGREQAEGEDWVIVEASVPSGFTTRRYWIRAHGEPTIRRILVLDAWGRVMGDEQRTQVRPLPRTAQPPSPPTPPKSWRVESVRTAPLRPEDKALLEQFQPPKGYQLISAIRRTCPCDAKQLSLCALYSNGLDEFTVFFSAPQCGLLPSADKPITVGSDVRGVVVAGRRSDGWGLTLVGEVRPESAREALNRWLGKL